MIWLFGSLATLFLLAFVVGIAIALKDRGKRTVRKGPEVYRELVDSSMERDSRYEGGSKKRWLKTGGTGYAVSSSAEYSWTELIIAWRQRRWRFLLPVLMFGSAIIGIPLFTGLTFTLLNDNGLVVFGIVLVVFALVAAGVLTKALRKALRDMPASASD